MQSSHQRHVSGSTLKITSLFQASEFLVATFFLLCCVGMHSTLFSPPPSPPHRPPPSPPHHPPPSPPHHPPPSPPHRPPPSPPHRPPPSPPHRPPPSPPHRPPPSPPHRPPPSPPHRPPPSPPHCPPPPPPPSPSPLSLSVCLCVCVCVVENKRHSDFLLLRDMLIRTHMQDLKDFTQDIHYENFRKKKLMQQGGSPYL